MGITGGMFLKLLVDGCLNQYRDSDIMRVWVIWKVVRNELERFAYQAHSISYVSRGEI